ncbi:hypothetical protein ACJX0J_032485, partial [Zea mays]
QGQFMIHVTIIDILRHKGDILKIQESYKETTTSHEIFRAKKENHITSFERYAHMFLFMSSNFDGYLVGFFLETSVCLFLMNLGVEANVGTLRDPWSGFVFSFQKYGSTDAGVYLQLIQNRQSQYHVKICIFSKREPITFTGKCFQAVLFDFVIRYLWRISHSGRAITTKQPSDQARIGMTAPHASEFSHSVTEKENILQQRKKIYNINNMRYEAHKDYKIKNMLAPSNHKRVIIATQYVNDQNVQSENLCE